MVMIPNGPGQKNSYVEFITLLKELVNEGKVPQSRIDDAARRILLVKAQDAPGRSSLLRPGPDLGGRLGRAPRGRPRVRAEIARAAQEREARAAAVEAGEAARRRRSRGR